MLQVAYTITDKAIPEFKVYRVENAWWMDYNKVLRLMDGYKAQCTDEMACINADITLAQLQQFEEVHTDFVFVKALCKQILVMRAMYTLITQREE